jgi:putative membrane protein
VWPFGPDWGVWGGLIAGLFWTVFWVALIVVAVILVRRELPNLQGRFGGAPAVRLLEERYARGEISREEFLERRKVLMQPPAPAAPPPQEPGSQPTEEIAGEDSSGAEPTQPLPPPP